MLLLDIIRERERNMAYISQEDKKELAPAIKAVLKKYNMKGSISIRNYSTLVVNLKEGSLNLVILVQSMFIGLKTIIMELKKTF